MNRIDYAETFHNRAVASSAARRAAAMTHARHDIKSCLASAGEELVRASDAVNALANLHARHARSDAALELSNALAEAESWIANARRHAARFTEGG